MKNSVGRGAIVLTISGLICKLFGALFRLPLTNIIGIEGIALFQMVMTIYSFALVCVSGGVTNSLAKLVSSARARGDRDAIGSFLHHAIIFTFGLCGAFAVAFVLFAPQIASLQGANGGDMSYRLLAILLPLGGGIGIARGLLQGYGNMTPTAISQIIEQVIKFAFGLIFAYLFRHQGSAGGVFGALLGITVSEVFAGFYLAIKVSHLGKTKLSNANRRKFYSATLPLTFSGVVLPFTHTIEALFIVKLLVASGMVESTAKAIYGLQTGVVGAILNFPLIISLAVSMSLLPNLSFLAEQKQMEKQKTVIQQSISTMWFLLIPLVVGIMSIARNVYPIIYPQVMEGFLDIAVQLTIVNGIAIVITAIMQQLVSILQANGYFKDSLIFFIIGGVVKIGILVAVAFLPDVSTFAISLSNIALASVVSLCILIKLKSLISLPAFDILLPLLSAVVMFASVRIILNLIPSFLGIGVAVLVGGAVYLTLAFPLTGKYIKILMPRLRKEFK